MEAKLSTYEDLQLLSILEPLPPAQVLAQRLHLISDHVVPSMLVQRESCPVHWVTWEAASSVSPLLSKTAASTAGRGHGAT